MKVLYCKVCGFPIGYKEFMKPKKWMSIAVPKACMCDECYRDELIKKGLDTSYIDQAIIYNHGYDVLGTPDTWPINYKRTHK